MMIFTLRLAARAALVLGLLTAGAHAQSRFPNIDSADYELSSALHHAQAAWTNNGPRFGGHLAQAMDHMRAAQAELRIAQQSYR